MARHDDAVDNLNRCLRGEISAAQTYRMALDKIDDPGPDETEAQRLRDIHREHGEAAQLIRGRIESLGGEADDDSGAWGAWAKTVQGTADLLGDTAALQAIRSGEEHGLNSYERALDSELDPDSRALLDQLAIRQRRHINELDTMMAAR